MAIARSNMGQQMKNKKKNTSKKPIIKYRKPKIIKGSYAGGDIKNYAH